MIYFQWGAGDGHAPRLGGEVGTSSSHYAISIYQDVQQSSHGRYEYTTTLEVRCRPILQPSIRDIMKLALGSNDALALAAMGILVAFGNSEQNEIAGRLRRYRCSHGLIARPIHPIEGSLKLYLGIRQLEAWSQYYRRFSAWIGQIDWYRPPT